MPITEVLGVTAGILTFFDFLLYSISIIKGKTTPNRATWFILTIVGTVIFSSYYALGARATIWVALGYAVGPFIIFLLSIKLGEGGWSYLDKICLTGALISLIIWWQSGSALIALIMNIIIDFFGVIPTIKKSYSNPSSEEGFPWLLTFVTCILNIFAIETWKFNIWIYPVYMFITNGVIASLLYFPKYRKT